MSSVALAPTAVSRPAVNPWFVATAVVVPTFMEILDTTIATASMRYIAGGLSATSERQRLGHDQLPGGQRHHPADHGLALGPPGPPQVLPPLHRRLHRRLGAVRPCHQPRATDPLPGDPGHRRRRAPARQPGDPDRRLPPREAGHGHDGVRRGGADRTGHRPDAGRLHHRQLQLALDLPHQPPDRRPRLPDVPLRGRGPGIPQEGAGGAESPAAQFRLHRPGAARPGDELLGDYAQQGAGVGLVQRPLLEGPDAVRPFRRWAWEP